MRYRHAVWLSACPLVMPYLQGCIPVVSHYERVDVTSATYFHSSCRASVGPTDIAYFPYHGIYISIQVVPLNFGLHLPDGATAELQGDVIREVGVTQAGVTIERVGVIKAAGHNSIDDGSKKRFGNVPDPYLPNIEKGVMSGLSIEGQYRWYLFLAVQPTNPSRVLSSRGDLERGSITLPTMLINGVRIEGETIGFSRTTYSAILPVNC